VLTWSSTHKYNCRDRSALREFRGKDSERDDKLSSWLDAWADSLRTVATVALDLANHESDRLFNHWYVSCLTNKCDNTDILFRACTYSNENRQNVSWDSVSTDPNSADISLASMARFYPTSALPVLTLTLHPYLLRYGVYLFPPGCVPKRQHRFGAGRRHRLRLADWPRFPNQLAPDELDRGRHPRPVQIVQRHRHFVLFPPFHIRVLFNSESICG
jgi:hypothetical protein